MSNGTPVKKKRLPTLAWLAIGCGVLIVVSFFVFFGLGFLAFQKGKEVVAESTGSESFEDFLDDVRENPAKKVAEAMIAMEANLEIVSTDDEAGTITFVNHETGETATLNFEDIAEGRFSVTTDEGEHRLDASEEGGGTLTVTGPEGETRFGAGADLDEVPDWVPVYPAASATQSLYHSTTQDGVSGVIASQTSDRAQQVLDYYKDRFEAAGWKIESESLTTTGDGSFGMILAELDGRTVQVAAAEEEGDCQINISYSG